MINSRFLMAVGVAFVGVAVLLTIRELQLSPGYLLSAFLLVLAIGAHVSSGILRSAALVSFAVGTIVAPMTFFLYRTEAPFLCAVGVSFASSLYLLAVLRAVWSGFDLKDKNKSTANLESVTLWFALILSSMTFSWGLYFWFLTGMHEDFIARRLIYTLVLTTVGVAFTVIGRSRPLPFLSVMGLTYLVAGVVKAVVYDTTHLDGFLRIGVFAGAGVLLLLGGALTAKPKQELPQDEEASIAKDKPKQALKQAGERL